MQRSGLPIYFSILMHKTNNTIIALQTNYNGWPLLNTKLFKSVTIKAITDKTNRGKNNL